MVLILRQLLAEPLFRLGLAIRVFLILVATPKIQTEWFVPFLRAARFHPINPWEPFIATGGDLAAFPYGLPYVFAFGPGVWLGDLIGGDWGARLGLGISLAMWETVLLVALRAVASDTEERRSVTTFFWLSPIALYVGYWHGQLDFFPVALLISALAATARLQWVRGALAFGVAVAAKFSMALPGLFLALYFAGRPRLQKVAPRVFALALVAPVLLIAPYLLSPGFRAMVLGTPETAKAFSLSAELSPGMNIYVLPMAYLALLYFALRLRKIDFPMLWTLSGVGYIQFLLLTPASPGWSVWALPFLALHAAKSGDRRHLLYWPFSFAFLGMHLLSSSGAALLGSYDLTAPLGLMLDPDLSIKVTSVLLTVIFATGVAMAVQMVRRDIWQSSFRIATRRPLAIGISGDSGAGKDTLVDAIAGMFGNDSVARLSGDDYHRWDRHKPMWRAITHLNPQANDLGAFHTSIARLAEGKTVRARHYDHSTGRMSKPRVIAPAEIIAASGLHALWSPELNRIYDVKLFLDMDEDLREFLKTQRDVRHRGHSPRSVSRSMARRRPDAEQFIKPQADNADLVLSLKVRHPSALSNLDIEISEARLSLQIQAPSGQNFDVLVRLLTSLCGMKVIETSSGGRTEVLIEGEPTAEDIAAAARRFAVDFEELLALEPVWEPGLRGVMQLIVLDQLSKATLRRSLAA